MDAPEATAVEVTDLRVVRGGVEVLHGVSFALPTGALAGVVGPSGSGKSTLLRSIVGTQIVASGSVVVLGAPAGSDVVRTRVGYVTQAPSVYADVTVVENLRYFATVLSAPAGDVRRVLEVVDMQGQAQRLVGSLSGGQISRVSLAVALLGSPEVLVLDEPTVGLDPVLRRDLWAVFEDLAASGVTLLVSSHVMDEARRCSRVLLLRDGALLADESPAALLERTGSPDLDDAFLVLCDAPQRPR